MLLGKSLVDPDAARNDPYLALRSPCCLTRPRTFPTASGQSVRRECLDHILVLGERHLSRVLREYVAYFNGARPHQGLSHATPEPSSGATDNGEGPVRAVPVLGGLHHDYRRAG